MVRSATLVLALLLACTRTGPESPPNGDGAQAPGPFARGNRAAVRDAVKAATGDDPGKDVCAEWPSTFPRVVVVGGFAHDRGCGYEGMFIDRTWHGSDHDPTKEALATSGWPDADEATRQRLARAWIDEIEHAFGGRFVDAETTAFELEDTPRFEPPSVRVTDDKGVIVSGWVAEPTGMVWEETYHFAEYRFGTDAKVETTVGRQFSVPGERIQKARAAATSG